MGFMAWFTLSLLFMPLRRQASYCVTRGWRSCTLPPFIGTMWRAYCVRRVARFNVWQFAWTKENLMFAFLLLPRSELHQKHTWEDCVWSSRDCCFIHSNAVASSSVSGENYAFGFVGPHLFSPPVPLHRHRCRGQVDREKTERKQL